MKTNLLKIRTFDCSLLVLFLCGIEDPDEPNGWEGKTGSSCLLLDDDIEGLLDAFLEEFSVKQ
jgi:hypothetical protein